MVSVDVATLNLNRDVKHHSLTHPGNQVVLQSLPPDRTSELRSCVKVEVDALGSPSLIARAVSVDVELHR